MTVNQPSTLAEITDMIGNYCDFSWTEPDGTAGGMEGELVGVEKDERGDWWALVDWGYGAKVGACVVSIKTDDQKP